MADGERESIATAGLTRYTPEEYLALERSAEFRSEYIDGRIIAKAQGESRPHNLIVTAICGAVGSHLLDSPCEVYLNEMRVKVSASGDYVYPDVMVSCDPQFEDEHADNLVTPIVIIEVLSDSTERHDRITKSALYRRIETLREYVFISQKEPLVERYVREGDFWHLDKVDDLNASLVLASVGVEIPLKQLYRRAMTPTRRVRRTPESEG